jgi:hypothetical protein
MSQTTESPVEVISPKAGVFKVAQVTLTHAQILTLNSVPVQFGDAPGANRVNCPIGVCYVTQTTAGAYGANPLVNVLQGAAVLTSTGINLNAANHRVTVPTVTGPNALFSVVENQRFTVQAAADNTLGNVANSVRIFVVYFVAERV